MSHHVAETSSSVETAYRKGEYPEVQGDVILSSTNPDDAFSIPPEQHAEPEAPALTEEATSSSITSLHSPPGSTRQVKRITDPPAKPSMSAVVVPKKWLRQGITGSDPTLPIFDGSSMDIKDHLIDIDTDSMETAPDVRVYFWMVGYDFLDPDYSDVPTDLEERKLFDAKMVRTGREHLKDLKQRGLGWFLSPSREISTRNATDSQWYRTPTTGISSDIACGIIPPLEDECAFFDYQDHHLDNLVATNMRIPLWWVETFDEGVVPGTTGWDDAIELAYYEIHHPGYAIYQGLERNRVIKEVVWAAVGDAAPVENARQVLRRDWPDIAALLFDPYPEYIGPGYLELQNSTVDQFLGRIK